MWSFKRLGVAAFLVIGSPAVQASVLSAWEQALTHDPDFQIALADRDISAEELPLARAALLPQLSAQAALGRAGSDITQSNILGREVRDERYYNTESWALQLRQPLFRFRAIAGYRQGRLRQESADAVLENARQALALRLVETLAQLAAAQAESRFADVEMVAAQRVLRQSQRQRRAGEVARTDEARAAQRLSQAAAGLSQAKAGLAQAEATWQRLTGTAAPAEVSLDADLGRQLLADDVSPDERLQQALERNPVLRANLYERDVARVELGKARGERLPTLDLVLARTYVESDAEATIGNSYLTNRLVLQAALPLYTGGALSAAIRQAEARLAKAEATLGATEAQIRQVVVQEAAALEYARHQADSAASAATTAELSRRTADLGGSAGTSTQADLNQAESAVAAAGRDQTYAAALALASWARMQQALGTLDEKSLQALESLLRLESSP